MNPLTAFAIGVVIIWIGIALLIAGGFVLNAIVDVNQLRQQEHWMFIGIFTGGLAVIAVGVALLEKTVIPR